ncbi:hypothetical protein JKF63_04971 [Porcisia hertigi]|uniref:Cilia- and flagella-associated protein 58 central coiled coil domain-containing protein n=1 Tax=Porcisia hertigi TaxID=2761500 RepID=A0A836I7T9_9TRYP|nr:hypothetical protein JKF63_04971 [Porcisia hertigi]
MDVYSHIDGSGRGKAPEGRLTVPSQANTAVSAATTAGPRMPLFTASENAEYQAIVSSRNAFFDFERHYQEVLMTLEGDDILDRFRAEYESLHNSFLHSHEGEGRLLRKCADLQGDIEVCVEKATAAAELSLGDRDIIATLKSETERSSQRLVQAKEKEMQLKEMILALKREIQVQQAKLQEPIELPAQEAALNNLQHLHETLQREEERLTQQFCISSSNVAATQRRIVALLNGNSANAAELSLIRESISRMEEEAQVTLASKAAKEEELSAVRETTARRIAYCTSQQHILDVLSEDHERNGQDLRDAQHEESRLAEEHQGVCRQLQNVNTALQECNEENDLWQRRMREKTAALQKHQATVASLHKRAVKAQQVVEALHRRNTVMESRRSEELERQHEAKERLQHEESALARAQQAVRTATQTALSARKEVNLLQQDIAGEEAEQRRNTSWLAEKRGQLRMLENVLSSCEEHVQQTQKEMYTVAQEAEMNDANAKTYAAMCAKLLGEIEGRNAELAEYEKKFAEGEAQVKQQQTLLEAMLVERNTYTSHCNQLKLGLSEQQHRVTYQLAQVQLMRSVIQKREKDVKVEAARFKLLRQQRKELEGQVGDYQRRTSKKQLSASLLGQEISELQRVLRDAADETARQQRRCNDVLHERELLNRQATDRTMEVNALYEKAHTQKSLLQRHEGLYNEQAQQLEHLEYQTVQFAQQLKQMRMFVARLPELRVLLNTATRELQREKVRVRALLDEAGRPLNVHPYNEAALAEPETYALLQRVHKLQRILVQRRTQLDEKQAAIQTAEQRYMKAKAAVAQQPGPEIAEQLIAYQQNLVKKNQHMGQMQEALEFFRSQTDLFKARHDVLRDRLTEMGKAYAENRAEQERGSRAGARNTSPCLEPPSTTSEPAVYHGFVAPPRPTTESVTTPASLLTPPPVSE